ncbi:MAG TPA: diaminopimelate decarboxylase [Candidatus Acidoferrum sp.]|nr:diaminopimelate decarboxylase [Candidatus Acidoferrum sp.]
MRIRPANRSKWTDPTEYTPHFAYRAVKRNGSQVREVQCDGVSLERIAHRIGTPAYVYSERGIEDAFRRLDRAFGSLPHRLCYALKANSNLSVLRILAKLGSRFDIVSGGELERLRHIGVPGSRIVFSGVGKAREEIRAAIAYHVGRSAEQQGILLFNVESESELNLLIDEAARHVQKGGQRVSTAIRVNPDILAGGHPHISTGYHHHKFGMSWSDALHLYKSHKNSRWIEWKGISTHIGSQILAVAPFRRAAARLASYVRELMSAGIHLQYIDVGGGLGIRYTNETPADVSRYARALSAIMRPSRRTLLIEPGRAIVGAAGVLLTRVLYVKRNGGRRFVIVDAAMNDLIRPSLYGATHPITPASVARQAPVATEPADVVGPVCESGDFLARDWPLPEVQAGDLLIVWATGAYGFVQSSNYNARLRPAEALVRRGRFRVIRRRQTFDEMISGE